MHPILIHDSGPIRTITLNRPEHRNALSSAMQFDLIAALEAAATSPATRVLVLAGAGKAFCAGLDLKALCREAETPPSITNLDLEGDAFRVARILRTLYELPIPTIAAVHGHAIAGGTGLATVCDFTLAVPAAKFGYAEVKVGFVPALVSAYLSLQIGDKRARGLLLSGTLCDAAQACSLGLVNEIVEPEMLASRVQQLAESLSANSRSAVRATKALLADQNRAWLDTATSLAIAANAAARKTPDFREGIAAFLEKRSPTWSA
jgi:methylglutaconyl-CoA hydratase